MNKELIEAQILRFLQSPSGAPFEAPLAQQFHVLPLLLDWTHMYALTSDGEVVTIPHDEGNASATRVNDERVRNMALFQGSRRWPAISSIVPTKPDDAKTCESCDGTGKTGPEHLKDVLICWCGGLGWLPALSPQIRDITAPRNEVPAKKRRWWQFWGGAA